uniref:G_PROTEIN_RECEP_F1_2 domain-containing protein n=1 Tax=Steinernema glaseri TaxID=37863 RepID=A0A1I7YTD3_9BILA
MNVSDALSSNDTLVDDFTLFEQCFYLVNGFLGTVFNSVVLFIALRHADTFDKPRQIIVMNMTFADLMMCLVYMSTRPFLDMFPKSVCSFYYITIWTCSLCSIANLLWLNVDKFVFIQFPLHYYTMISRGRILFVTVLTWVALIAISSFVYTFMEVKGGCHDVRVNPYIYLPICILYVVMIMASFTISSVIYLIAKNYRKMEARARLKMFQRLFFLFSSTMWTFVTCLPYRLLFLVNTFCTSCISYEYFRLVTSTFFSILNVGIVINPLITVVTQRLYRHHLYVYCKRLRNVLKEDSFDSSTNFTAGTSTVAHRSKMSTVGAPSAQELEKLKDNTEV